LNRSGDSGHPCLVPDFRGNGFNFSPTFYLKISMRLPDFLFTSILSCTNNFN
jgi:hypothetical protein